MNTQKTSILVTLLILVVFILGRWVVSAATKTYDTYENGEITSEEIITLINESDTIFLHRNRPHLGPSYDVVVNGKKVGVITGKFISFWNDTMTFVDINGNTLATACEGFEFWRNSWVVVDANNQVSIGLKGKVSSRVSYYILNKNEEVLGLFTKNWTSILGDGKVSNDGTIFYLINIKITSNIYITKENDCDINMFDVMMLAPGFNKENEKSGGTTSSSSNNSGS